MLRSILVGLDGTPWSESATALALDRAGRFDARLLGLGVVDEPWLARAESLPMGESLSLPAGDFTLIIIPPRSAALDTALTPLAMSLTTP